MNTRKDFLRTVSCCALTCAFGARLIAETADTKTAPGAKETDKGAAKPTPPARAYCGTECAKCPTYKATLESDMVVKKKVAERWSKLVGREVAAEEVYCYGCRSEKGMALDGLARCTLRPCAIKKNIEGCYLCPELANCDNAAWTKWKGFKGRVQQWQKELKS